MTLEEAIERAESEVTGNDKCSREHLQLAIWLKELLEFKKAYPCECGGLGRPPHTCPFAEEIHEDYEKKCSCCEHCEEQCALDI